MAYIINSSTLLLYARFCAKNIVLSDNKILSIGFSSCSLNPFQNLWHMHELRLFDSINLIVVGFTFPKQVFASTISCRE